MSETIKKAELIATEEPKVAVRTGGRFSASLRFSLSAAGRRFFGLPLYGLVVGLVIAFAVAWQVPFNYKIDPDTEFHLKEPFVQNFNSVEPANGVNEQNPFYYRWSRGEGRLVFPAIGKNSYKLKLTLASDPNPNKDFQLFANETRIGDKYVADAATKTYEFDIPAEAIKGSNGDLNIAVKFAPFTPKGDSRTLGFAFLSAELSATGNGLLLPPLVMLGYLLGGVLLVYAIVLVSGGTGRAGAIVGGVWGAVLVGVVISGGRAWLTIFADKLAFALTLSLILTAILRFTIYDLHPTRGYWRFTIARLRYSLPATRNTLPNPPPETRNPLPVWALSIFGLALAIRFGGLIYPGMFSVDIGFHVNRYNDLWQFGNFFSKIESKEWGGRLTYYPPTTYLFAGLFRWLFEDTITLLRFWMCALDASRALLIYFLVQRVTGNKRAAVMAAVLLAAMPVGLISLSFGQVAQLTGEWVTLAILCMVVVYFDKLRQPLYFLTTLVLLVIAFVQHPGVILLSGATFFMLAVVLFFRRREGGKVLLVIFGLALLISIGLYNRVTLVDMLPQAWQTLESKLTGKPLEGKPELNKGKFQVGGSVDDTRLGLKPRLVSTFGEVITGGLSGFWREAQVYYLVFPLILMLSGIGWMWYSSRPNAPPLNPSDDTLQQLARRRMAWASLIWLVVVVLFALVGLFLNLYVRYSLFLLPIVAAGAGVCLSRLWQRTGWSGKLLAIATCIFVGVSGLVLYFDRVIYYIDLR